MKILQLNHTLHYYKQRRAVEKESCLLKDYLFLKKIQLQFTIPLEIFKKSGLKYRGKVNSGTTEEEAQFHSHCYKMSDQEKDAYQALSYEEETLMATKNKEIYKKIAQIN